MADMAMLAKLAMLAGLPLTQDGQLGLLKGRMPPFCRRGVSQYLGKNAMAAKYANSAITGLGGNVGERTIAIGTWKRNSSGEARGNSRGIRHSLFCLSENGKER